MLRLALLLFLYSLIPASLSAQQSPSVAGAASSAPADQAAAAQGAALVQRAVAALTGGAPVADVTMTGNVTVNRGSTTESGTITLVATAAGQSQITTVLPSGNWVTTQNYAASPRTSTSAGPSGAAQDTAPEDVLGPHPAWFCPALLVGAIAPQTYLASYVGQETRSGSAVQHVSFWPQASSSPTSPFLTAGQQVLTGPAPSLPLQIGQQELFVDSSSLLPKELIIRVRGYRSAFNSSDPAHPTIPTLVDERVQFSDYRQVQGRMVAFHIQVSFGPVPGMDIQLSSVTFNTGATVAAN
ncbi:MAG: hypothetical protein LAN36_11205 [Acidobacteriia bacterium]|nr:hypothetical protein [Terriglobia bacterium]